ncbi:sulfatase-like hydrolase/transferase, partial [Sphingobacterium mizutaii]|uniref:sulfatase-like hydrolase/transferase n=1 Tax=Sphingobacterium mizutaii TaxID=1010 RepID=UPI0028A07AB9
MIYRIPLLLLLSILFNNAFAQKNLNKPNIILVFMDDLGYGDLGVTGALGYHTPVLDRMANNGIRFTN